MRRKISVLLFCALFLFLTACGSKSESLSVEKGEEPDFSSVEPESFPEPTKLYQNPLTGIAELSEQKSSDRPVAVMINNISVAQPVQTGLSKADIIFETEVEGGITRLLAVFQDITKVEKIGTIRSARYPYVDIALGFNALYLHCGQDNTYCKPHLKDIDDANVENGQYGGARIKNNLAKEHTLYAYGEKLWNDLVQNGFKTKNTNAKSWVTFAGENESVTLSETAEKVTVPFPGSGKSNFRYHAQSGYYTRYFNDTVRKDYFTGETTEIKNVFVLLTAIRNYPDGYHRQVDLISGDGYYAVNGTYEKIHWSKGAAKNGFTFTKEDGTPLIVSPGNSWVCIVNKSTSQPKFE